VPSDDGAIVRRAVRWAAGIGVAGSAVFLGFRRWDWALGFGLGAALSLLNVVLIRRSVHRLTPAGAALPLRRILAGSLFRTGLVAAVVVAGVLLIRVNLLAVGLGLLAALAALATQALTSGPAAPPGEP
jgi:hypothetical protein